MKDFREVEVESEHIRGFYLPPLAHRTYDPEKIIPAHCKQTKFKWSYQHTEYPVEDRIKNWYNKDSEAAPTKSSDQEEQDNQNLEERVHTLGGALSSKARKPRTGTGHNPSA